MKSIARYHWYLINKEYSLHYNVTMFTTRICSVIHHLVDWFDQRFHFIDGYLLVQRLCKKFHSLWEVNLIGVNFMIIYKEIFNHVVPVFILKLHDIHRMFVWTHYEKHVEQLPWIAKCSASGMTLRSSASSSTSLRLMHAFLNVGNYFLYCLQRYPGNMQQI